MTLRVLQDTDKSAADIKAKLEALLMEAPGDPKLARFLLNSRRANPEAAERLGLDALITELLNKHPILRGMTPRFAMNFMNAVLDIMRGKYEKAWERMLDASENPKIYDGEEEMYINLGLNIGAAAENKDWYVYFCKVRIDYLLDNERNEEAKAEIDEFLKLIPDDYELLAMKYFLDPVSGTNLYANSGYLYDIFGAGKDKTADLPFYIGYAKAQKGNVLDIGCGTGRVSLALAKSDSNMNITAVDLSESMLGVFRDKLAIESRDVVRQIEVLHGDFTEMTLRKKYSLVIAPNRVFQLLPEGEYVMKFLSCIHSLMDDNGLFIVNVYNPLWVARGVHNLKKPNLSHFSDRKNDTIVTKETWMGKYDKKNYIRNFHQKFTITHMDGRQEHYVDTERMKEYGLSDMERILDAADMDIVEGFSFYNKKPLSLEGVEIILVCRKKQS